MRYAGFLFFCCVLHAAEPARFAEHTIATGLKGGYQVVVADLNHDGKPDLIALASGMPELVWYENPTWERHVIAGGFSRMINCAAWDTDGDGIPEIVLASGFSNEAKNSVGIVSVLHHDGDPRGPWKVTEIDRLTTSHRLRWADIDGNGKKVLVNAPLTGAHAEAPDYRDHTPLVFYRPGEWKRELIGDQNEGVVHGIYVIDWDGDGRDEHAHGEFRRASIFTNSAKTGDGRGPRLRRAIRRHGPRADRAMWRWDGLAARAISRPSSRGMGTRWRCTGSEGASWQRRVIDDSLVDGHTICDGGSERRWQRRNHRRISRRKA